ncbi:ATP-binding cassette domain-containing protein [Persicobacter diffluens]|uniref:ABC transporter domain-containing protein n=1 Tax=Persicobacter diffluens TaxID=981 RepID=A0AAN4VY07_9BACT|nr:hypothetical protein PEDI_09770 [Persicobacter diffluens]
MNEKTLKGIIRFFAVILPSESINEEVRSAIARFSEYQSGSVASEKYLTILEAELSQPYLHEDFFKESTLMTIKEKFSSKERLMIIALLAEILLVKANAGDHHLEIYYEVCQSLDIPLEAAEVMKRFSIASNYLEMPKENIMVIHEEGAEQGYRFWAFRKVREHICVLRVPVLGGLFVKQLGQGKLYLDNKPVPANEVIPLHKGGFLRLEGSDDMYYTDLVWHFFNQQTEDAFLFEVNHVDYAFPNGHLGLNDIHFTEKHSSLVGIMGLSGAGKTTLVNVLNGNSKPLANAAHPEGGTIKINGVDIHQDPESVKGVIGYVPQEDALIEKLTVSENLTFSAKLSLSHLSESEIQSLVHDKLQELSLLEIADLQVGNPLEGGISGGQRKRLNIAMELLREPSVLFVDEPTSGLSSRDSDRIMRILRELSQAGKLVFVVIHQPSSEIFKSFDRILILDRGGCQIYHGQPILAVQRIKKYHTDRSGAVCVQCGNVDVEHLFEEIDKQKLVVGENGRPEYARETEPMDWKRSFSPFNFLLEDQIADKIKASSAKPKINLNVPSKLKQARIYLKRDVLSKFRNKQYLLITLLQAPVLAFALAMVVRYAPEGQSYSFGENINIPSYLFMSVFVALFMGLVQSGEEIFKDRPVLKREAFLNLNRSAYLSSKILLLFLVSFVQSMFFVTVSIMVLEIPISNAFFWLIIFSITCLANVLGLIISTLFNSVVNIYISIPILIIPQLLLSGVVVDFNEVNPVLSNQNAVPMVGEIMPSRWAFEGVMVGTFLYNEYEEQVYDFEQKNAEAEYYQLYYTQELNDILRKSYVLQGEVREKAAKVLAIEIKYLSSVFEGLPEELLQKVLNKEDLVLAEFEMVEGYIDGVRSYYANVQKEALKAQKLYLEHMTLGKGDRNLFEAYKKQYYNATLARYVKATSSIARIVETESGLVQKINPIFMTPRPFGVLGFRSIMYVPKKYFMGFYIPTPLFNTLFLWVITLLLIGVLYTDVLNRLVSRIRTKFH